MSLTNEQTARIVNPERIWQVRRLCQVRHAINQASSDGHKSPQTAYGSDPALSALLRCLLYELQAEIGAISLLDDEDQHFLSVAHAADSENPDVRRADWFGCEQIPIRGGICERTITHDYQSDTFPVYEILDLQADESTRSLPVVDGRTARFGYYAGVPLTTKDGLNVGALFVFKTEPQTKPLAKAKRRCLVGTAQHVIDQIMRTVGAMENSRSHRCSLAVTSITHSEEQPHSSLGPTGAGDQAENVASLPSELFGLAATLLSHSLDLENVTLQELPRSSIAARVDVSPAEVVFAGRTGISNPSAKPVDCTFATQLWEAFPSGVALHLESSKDGGTFLASAMGDTTPRQRLKISLCERFPGVQQCVFMPLRDTFHDRDTAFILGWTSDRKRVYSSMTDLPSLSSFGMAVMAQLRRLEAQVLSRKKADFLASVSHEMRSPLHGLLACIGNLYDTDCSAAQIDLLETAEACGLQLQNNIDNVFQYSKISTASRSGEHPLEQSSTRLWRSAASNPKPDLAVHGRSKMVAFVEDVVEKSAHKHQIVRKSLQFHELSIQPPNQTLPQSLYRDSQNSLITFDATRGADFTLDTTFEIRSIVDNLVDNCLKFTTANGCIRIHIDANDEVIHMLFADSGRGMPADFAQHYALEPFNQQDPLDDGIGLGFSLVRNAIQALDGEMSLDTDTKTGTRVSITLPRSKLTLRSSLTRESFLQDFVTDNEHEYLGKTARLFEPGLWTDPHNARHVRCRRSLIASLSCTLRSWLKIDLNVWKSDDELPTYFIVFYADLDRMREEVGVAFEESQKIVICPSSLAQATLSPADLGVFAALTSPLTPSKLCAAISTVSRNSQKQSITSYTCRNQNISKGQQTTLEANPVQSEALAATGELRQYYKTPIVKSDESARTFIEHALSNEPVLHPRLLLVDDNAINLKVISMYAKKCSKGPFVLAGGGQQAIDLFNDASVISGNQRSSGFEIVVLDLSMPEVSGFDVASAIRSMERSAPCRPRAYIAALTGLVSDKDRRAAFEAGVDEYVTKPATVRDLQSVIANWRIANGS